jgi:rSAM/selenodomain-associated transferase 1
MWNGAVEIRMNQTLGMFVRQPVPGEVKTRLAAELGAQRACEMYSAFLADLTTRFRAAADRRFLCFAPDDASARMHFQKLAGIGYGLWPQPPADLGNRLKQFFTDHLHAPADRVVVIGSDSPTLPREFVEQAFEMLKSADCVLGPATDGGYYLIGQRHPGWDLFAGVEWSTNCVLDQTVAQIVKRGIRLALLPVWYDVDTADDWSFLRSHVRALAGAGSSINLEATRRVLGLDTAIGAARV